jgi:hypothetical protein
MLLIPIGSNHRLDTKKWQEKLCATPWLASPRAYTLNPGNSIGANSRNNLFKVMTGYLGGAGNPFQAQFGARFSF